VSTEAISVQSNDGINSIAVADTVNETSNKTSQTSKLSRSFLDSKNASLFAKSKLISLKVKKMALDQEIAKYHDMLLQYKEVKALETLCLMYTEHLTNLMREFLDVTQEITQLNQLV
jgi:hypothetical protein